MHPLSGDANPMRLEHVRAKFRGERNPMHKPEVRDRHFTAMRSPETRAKLSQRATQQNAITRLYIQLSGYDGPRHKVKKAVALEWLSTNAPSQLSTLLEEICTSSTETPARCDR